MPLTLRLRRLGFRAAYRGLQVWWFLRRPETEGVKCLLTTNDQVLLVRHTYGRPDWNLPGGGVHRGEDPAETARREMREELGIEGARWQPAGTVHGQESFRHDTVHIFRAELPTPAVAPNLAELAEVRWFPWDERPPDLARYARLALDGQPPG